MVDIPHHSLWITPVPNTNHAQQVSRRPGSATRCARYVPAQAYAAASLGPIALPSMRAPTVRWNCGLPGPWIRPRHAPTQLSPSRPCGTPPASTTKVPTQMSSPRWMHLPNGDEGVLQRACSRHGVHIGAEARRAHDHPATVPEVAPEHGADDGKRLTHLALCSPQPVMSTTLPRPLANAKLSRATNLVHVQQF